MDHNFLELNNGQATVADEWVPFSLTLVEYPKGDKIGKLLAFVSLAPFGIGAGFVALILFRRDLHTIMFFIGTLVNEILNYLLKHMICEPRPLSRGNLYTEYGMPSSHSQFIWFFSVYVLLFVLIRLHQINNNNLTSALWRVAVVCFCILLSLLVCVSRIYLQYHSMSQVLVGSLIGALFAVAWFTFVHRTLTPLFPMITAWKISEFFMLRDTTLIPNVLWFEYTTTRQEARARWRKIAALKPPQ